VRGGLDDALDKLARRDELRRRVAGEPITPPAVTALVEEIAAVVGRYPTLAVTVGVEGAGDPVLLHFAVEDGVVQVTADNAVAARVDEAAPGSPRHADFDIDPDDAEEEAYQAEPAGPVYRPASYDDRDRYDPGTGYGDLFDPPAEPGYDHPRRYTDDHRESGRRPHPFAATPPPEVPAPHVFAATPPPDVPPRTPRVFAATPRPDVPPPRPYPEPYRAPEDAPGRRLPNQRTVPASPAPLPRPVPLRVDPREADQAAKRLAAMLREDPSLLRQSPE
jgi:hypothetical protein